MDINQYIGKPYASGGRGPEAFDCWGLVMDVFKRQYDIELSNQPAKPEEMMAVVKAFKDDTGPCGDWIPVLSLDEGIVVTCGRNRFLTHAGVGVGDGLVLHTTFESKAVVCQSIRALRAQYSLIRFFKHKNQ